MRKDALTYTPVNVIYYDNLPSSSLVMGPMPAVELVVVVFVVFVDRSVCAVAVVFVTVAVVVKGSVGVVDGLVIIRFTFCRNTV